MRFIWGHALVHFLSLVEASSYGLHPYLAPVSTALLRVGRQGIYSSLMFTPAFWRGWHMPIEFCFKRCISPPWVFSCAGFSCVSDLDNLLRVPLRSWGSFGFSTSSMFLEGVPKFLAFFFPIVPARASLLVLSGLLGDLCYFLRVFDCLTARLSALLLLYLLSQGSQFSWGFSKFLRRTATQLWVISREVWSLPSVSLVLWRRRFWWADSPTSDGIFSVAVFTHVLWGVEDKIESKEEMVSNVLHVFYYRLTLSCGDFAKCCIC